jgi:hypothetical protein
MKKRGGGGDKQDDTAAEMGFAATLPAHKSSATTVHVRQKYTRARRKKKKYTRAEAYTCWFIQ